MEYPKYKLEIELTGITRKKAAEIISQFIGGNIMFSSENSQYEITDSRGNRTWLAAPSGSIETQRMGSDRIVKANDYYSVNIITPYLYRNDLELLLETIKEMKAAGALANDTTKTTVMTQISSNYNQAQESLKNLISSKETLIQKALGTNGSPNVRFTERDYAKMAVFDFYETSLEPKKLKGFIQLSAGLTRYAAEHKVIAKEDIPYENEKFAFRTWLVRLGFVGSDFKEARSVFMENLSGNTAWKTKEVQERHRNLRLVPEPMADVLLTEKNIDDFQWSDEPEITMQM